MLPFEQGLKIKNEVVVHPNGTLTFENNASLIQINDTPDCKFREYNVPKNQW
jgi:hypothetical protein